MRLIAVAPSFNNAATLRAVLDGLATQGLGTIVVNDGATDDTRAQLEAWLSEPGGDRHVVHHEVNRGKAAAMHTGFARAAELGFTHAVTIDTDGQHDPADVAELARAAAAAPDAIIVGDRPCEEGYPLGSLIGRRASNALVRLVSGARVGDSQCGLRIYPLETVLVLDARTGRYAFETEILVRAAWANVPIVDVPIRCIYHAPAGRVSHFRLLPDTVSGGAMHLRLLARSLLPWPTRKLIPVTGDGETGTIFDRSRRWLTPLRAWRSLRLDPRARERVGAAIGWGLFIGTQPPLGYKGALCLLIAKVFRLQPLIVLGTSSLSTPPLGFVLWGAAIVVGHVLLHGTMPSAAQYDMVTHGALPVVRALALEWVVGGLVFGTALGVTAWLVADRVIRWFSGRRAGDAVPSSRSTAFSNRT